MVGLVIILQRLRSEPCVCVCVFLRKLYKPKVHNTLLLLRYSDILSWLESLSFYFFIDSTSLDFDISHLVIWYERFKVNIIKGCCWCVCVTFILIIYFKEFFFSNIRYIYVLVIYLLYQGMKLIKYGCMLVRILKYLTELRILSLLYLRFF